MGCDPFRIDGRFHLFRSVGLPTAIELVPFRDKTSWQNRLKKRPNLTRVSSYRWIQTIALALLHQTFAGKPLRDPSRWRDLYRGRHFQLVVSDTKSVPRTNGASQSILLKGCSRCTRKCLATRRSNDRASIDQTDQLA